MPRLVAILLLLAAHAAVAGDLVVATFNTEFLTRPKSGSGHELVFCLIRGKHIEQARSLGGEHVLYHEGNRLIVSNRARAPEVGR